MKKMLLFREFLSSSLNLTWVCHWMNYLIFTVLFSIHIYFSVLFISLDNKKITIWCRAIGEWIEKACTQISNFMWLPNLLPNEWRWCWTTNFGLIMIKVMLSQHQIFFHNRKCMSTTNFLLLQPKVYLLFSGTRIGDIFSRFLV